MSLRILFPLLVAINTLLVQSAFAGNDTIYFRGETSVYQYKYIEVDSLAVMPSDLPGASNSEFKPVEFMVFGKIDGEDVSYVTQFAGYQYEGAPSYTMLILARYGSKVYGFKNIGDLKNGQNYYLIGQINELGQVEVLDDLSYEIRLVNYNPTILDKIMSWVISLGGRMTSADEWLEVKFIEKK